MVILAISLAADGDLKSLQRPSGRLLLEFVSVLNELATTTLGGAWSEL